MLREVTVHVGLDLRTERLYKRDLATGYEMLRI